jgi:hypothetical protein
MKTCDLHTHSVFSDGTFTPVELIDHAIECGLSALALTDHNTISGLNEFIAAAEGKPLEIAPGVEFTTAYNGTELHILGLFVMPDAFSKVNEYINRATILKEESNYKLVKKLNENGYRIRYIDILENSKGHVNRANIAAELMKKGYLKSISEGFNTILSKAHGFYEPPERLSSLETIRFIRSIGAVAVWAHPYIHMNFEQADEFLPRAIDAGLQGMETMYSMYSPETTARAREVCLRYGLHESGGSDFHGANKPHISLGRGEDNLEIPYEFYKNLRALL